MIKLYYFLSYTLVQLTMFDGQLVPFNKVQQPLPSDFSCFSQPSKPLPLVSVTPLDGKFVERGTVPVYTIGVTILATNNIN